MPVQQHVLNWLYSVLTSEYHDVNRCYEDVAQVLNRFPSLSPRTDVHTFPDGSSALLLHISGTIPVDFRGSTYRFPLSIWMPHAYPREPPLIYVTPTETMMVRPGQHVDPQGQVYHPYLVGWAQFWDKSTLQDFMTILSDVFAKEPPVVARQQARSTSISQTTSPTPPPLPPLPPSIPSQQMPQRDSAAPPRLPPKSPQGAATGPPVPPLPQNYPKSRNASRYDSAPPLPTSQPSAAHPPPSSYVTQPQAAEVYQPHRQFSGHQNNSGANITLGGQNLAQGNSDAVPPYSQGQWTPVRQTSATWDQVHGQPANLPPQQPQIQAPYYQQHQFAGTAQQLPQRPVQPSADLLLDDPLTLDIPPPSTIKAPPIPPNPEKDALLRQLAQTLAAMRQQSRQQNESSMAGLQAQRVAMGAALSGLQSESSQLTQLSNVLTSNANILQEAMHQADTAMDRSKGHSKPDIDELLVAPTVVSNQLYTLVAEERALGDAIFMLGRAMEKGRITPAVFSKATRSLAREWYLKKALAKKIGEGMGMVAL